MINKYEEIYDPIQYYTLFEQSTMASGSSNIPGTQATVTYLKCSYVVQCYCWVLQQASAPSGSPSTSQVILHNVLAYRLTLVQRKFKTML